MFANIIGVLNKKQYKIHIWRHKNRVTEYFKLQSTGAMVTLPSIVLISIFWLKKTNIFLQYYSKLEKIKEYTTISIPGVFDYKKILVKFTIYRTVFIKFIGNYYSNTKQKTYSSLSLHTIVYTIPFIRFLSATFFCYTLYLWRT